MFMSFKDVKVDPVLAADCTVEEDEKGVKAPVLLGI